MPLWLLHYSTRRKVGERDFHGYTEIMLLVSLVYFLEARRDHVPQRELVLYDCAPVLGRFAPVKAHNNEHSYTDDEEKRYIINSYARVESLVHGVDALTNIPLSKNTLDHVEIGPSHHSAPYT
jgi:hypothetical protein